MEEPRAIKVRFRIASPLPSLAGSRASDDELVLPQAQQSQIALDISSCSCESIGMDVEVPYLL